MTEFDCSGADHGELARLFASDFAASDIWGDDDLPAVYGHQLEAPLAADLDDMAVTPSGEQAGKQMTFGDLLRHPRPPIKLLAAVKQFAKLRGEDAHPAIPRQVAAVLYLAAISAALLRCSERITEASNEELLPKLRWAAARDWIDKPTRELIQQAMASL